MDHVLKRHFDIFIGQGLPPALAGLDVSLFSDKALLDIWRNNRKGLAWVDSEGNVLHGAVDAVLCKGTKLIVLDYKTRGFPLKEDTADYYKDQLDIYTYLLQKNGYETEDYAYLLFYYPTQVTHSGTIVFQTELKKMPVNAFNAEKIVIKAVSVLQKEIPQMNGCKYCEWGKEWGRY